MENEKEQLLLEELERSSRNPGEYQDRFLAAILERNASTDYFRKHGLEPAVKQVFREKAPVIEYEDIKNEIQRIADGEAPTLLCADSITDMFTSSGTSGGAHKLFPKAKGHFAGSKHFFDLTSALLNRDVPEVRTGKALYFLYVRSTRRTDGGTPAYPALTGYYNSSEFRNRSFDPSNDFTSPIEVILCTDSVQATYCHLLCGLIHAEAVTKIGCFFASVLVRSIRSLETWWQELSRDLRTGTLSERVTDPACRDAVGKILKPNPELADLIDEACCGGSLKGIVRKLWPNAKVLDTVVTGAMEQYVGTIDYLSDGLPIASMIYASSESYLGVNLDPICEPSRVSYMLLPGNCYFEFLPVSRSSEVEDENPKPLELVEVEQGRDYELVITTNAGLYRYRMGDVLMVEGFHNRAPLFSFVCRRNILLSIDSDKTDEKELHAAVMKAFAFLQQSQVVNVESARLTDYSSYADLSSHPPHYVIYWELSSELDLDPEAAAECCFQMEESLSVVYHRGRAEKSIGALELRLIKPGTFDRVADEAAARGGSVAQFKLPRCIKNSATTLLEIVNGGVYCRYFSPRAPKY